MQIEDLRLFNIEEANKPVLIYGAGKYASVFLTYMQMKEMGDGVKGCIVSNVYENNSWLWNLPIKSVDEIENLKEYMIVIAVIQKNANSVYRKLEEKEVTVCYQITTDLFEKITNEIATFFHGDLIQKNKVFIDCYAGLGYRCNCKYIAKELKKHGYEIIWNLSDRAIDDIPEWITKVKRYSYEYFREAYTSKIYITNDSVEPIIHKKQNQLFVCSWHGAGPFKKINIDLCPDEVELKNSIQKMYHNIDIFISPSEFNTQVIRRAFGYEGEVLECGSPRVDCLLHKNNFRNKICEYYQIAPDSKIVLYAPTFRKASIGDEGSPIVSFENYDLEWNLILEALEKRFEGSFVLLYRFHHQLYRFAQSNVSYSGAVNVTRYPDVQELLGAADILITDYSSIMWDFSLQRKPVFLYQKDVDEYMRDRGFYSKIEDWPYIKARTSEDLCEKILQFDNKKYISELNLFLEKYGTFDDGHACERTVERILQKTVLSE